MGNVKLKFKREPLLTVFFFVFLSDFLIQYYVSNNLFIFRALAVLGILFYYFYFIIKTNQYKFFNRNNVDKTSKLILSIFYLNLFIILLYSFSGSLKDMITLFFYNFALPSFFLSTAVLFSNGDYGDKILDLTKRINILLPALVAIEYLTLKNVYATTSLGCFITIEILFWDKSSFKRKVYLSFLAVFYVFICKFSDDRTDILRIALTILLYFLFVKCARFFDKKVVKSISIILVIVVMFLLFQNFQIIYLFVSNLFSNYIDTTDTRSFLYTELKDQLKPGEYLVGRGYLGIYFSDYFYHIWGTADQGDFYNRFTSEVATLELLLKGGVILLITFLSVLLRAIILGFIKSKHHAQKFRFALFVLMEFAIFSVNNTPQFSVRFLIIWLVVGYIMSNKEKVEIENISYEPANL